MNCCRIVGLRHPINPVLIHLNIRLYGFNRQRGSWGAYAEVAADDDTVKAVVYKDEQAVEELCE
jgi:tRNA(Ile2) C34 agmatinyltransferase TiaS